MRVSVFLGLLSAVSFSLALSGCSSNPAGLMNSVPASQPVAGTALQGRVHGGQQPIAGASVYLYAANITGYGNAAVSLLKSSGSNTHQDGSGNYYVTTDSGGNFTITGDYSCPSSNSQVYVYSVGGNPGSGTNSAAGLLAALGTCATPITSSFIFVDEVSTIATAYAIAGYATDATHVSSSGSTLAVTGMTNAFASVANLETLNTGQALSTTPAGNGAVPQGEIDTLANILAACINSTGPGSTACSTLLSNAKNGSTTPTDTAMAAINIAHNPGANTSTLYSLQTAGGPFQPTLGVAPNDFTIAINFTGGGLDGGNDVAIDKSGNVWVSNGTGTSISEFSPTGAVLSGSSGFTGGGLDEIAGIAIDSAGNVWGANLSSVSEISSSGSPISGSNGYTGGGIDLPNDIAFDGSGHAWITNQIGASLSELTASGSPISGSGGFTGGGLNYPAGLAIDTSNNIWVANIGADSITEFASSGAADANSPISTGGLNAPGVIEVDAQGNIWVSNTGADSISEFNSSGVAISSTAYTGGGLKNPHGVAIDGAGNVWLANYGGSSISEFNSSGTAISGANGFLGGGLDEPIGIRVDGSGNLWIANYVGGSGTSITEFVGAAAPVVTPLVANLLSPYGQHAVNKP